MLKSTTLRDFSGGWNALDDDLNVSGEYQPILDNIRRGLDNNLSVRWGYELFGNMTDGAVTTITPPGGSTLAVITGTREVTVSWTAHPFLDHEHITFLSVNAVGGLLSAELNSKPHGVRKIDANTFKFSLRTVASSTQTVNIVGSVTRDNHMLAGNIVEINYFNDFLVVLDTRGEIAKIDRFGTKTRIWDYAIAKGLTSSPVGWSECAYASSDVFKGQLIMVNGKDKPIQIDFTIAAQVQYLVDLGTGSNANTPVCKYVKAVGRWLVMSGDPLVPNRVHISSTDTSGTFFNDLAPNDALYLDINFASNSPSIAIRGIAKFRQYVVVAFDDSLTLVLLGTFDSTGKIHQPTINDVIARHGSIAHKSMVFLGFDLIMADPIGVPSVAKSLYDNTLLPSRQSDIIAPPLQKNIGRLSPATLELKVFAVYSTHDFEYLLFIPDYDNDVLTLQDDPFFIPDALVGSGKIIVKRLNHGLDINASITIANASMLGGIAAGNINTTFKVTGILDEDFFVIDTGQVSTAAAQGGGSGVTMTRNFTETICYSFTYNKKLKAHTWARYRGFKFNTGTTSVYGRVFLATDHRVWRLGNQFEPIYADNYNGYDAIWQNATAYTIGTKQYDAVTNETYVCAIAHTSVATGPFSGDRITNSTYWTRYKGEPINWAMETPWADYNERTKLKRLTNFGADTRGRGRMTVKAFSDFYYRSKLDGSLTPQLSMDFVGGDSPGFGAGFQTMGSGRISSRQKLWPFPMSGKLLKFRIEGSTTDKLKIVSLQFLYLLGGFSR